MLAPGVVERSMFHNLAGALTGGLQNEFWSSQKRFGLAKIPSVSGMVVVGSPQPMETIAIPGGKDAITIRKDDLAGVQWNGG